MNRERPKKTERQPNPPSRTERGPSIMVIVDAQATLYSADTRRDTAVTARAFSQLTKTTGNAIKLDPGGQWIAHQPSRLLFDIAIPPDIRSQWSSGADANLKKIATRFRIGGAAIAKTIRAQGPLSSN